VDELLASNQLARELIGWSPSVTLDEGITQTADYLRTHPPQRPTIYTI
jgi:nucleoside-diphosphate-sugar epimerase